MSSRIQLQSAAVVPSSGRELDHALFCRTRVGSQLHSAERRRWLSRCSSETYGRCGLGVRRRQWSGGEPDSVPRFLIRFQALAGSGLPSARNSSHLVLRASSESRLTSPHAAKYSIRFDSSVSLRVLRCLMASIQLYRPRVGGLRISLGSLGHLLRC